MEKSSRPHGSGHRSAPCLGWDAALGSPVETVLLRVRSTQLDLDVHRAHSPGTPAQGTSPGLCPGGSRTIHGGADPAAKGEGRREGCPGSHRSPGALGTAQRFGAISWLSLGFGVFNLVHLWVLPAGSTEVWGKNTPLGYPSLNPSCRCCLQHGAGKLGRKREKIDPKI